MTFETFDQSDEKTWPDQKIPTYQLFQLFSQLFSQLLFNFLSTFFQLLTFLNFFLIFSCPQQLNRTHCLSVRRAPLTIRAFTTLQSDPRDLWPLRHLIRQIFGRFSDFWKIFRFLEDFQIFGRFSDLWKIFRILEDFQNFGRLSEFWKFFRFSDF